LSSISFYDIPHRSIFKQTESPINEVNHLLPQSSRSTQERVCYVCNRTFRRVNQLKRHQKRMHSVTGKFKCPECPLKFDKEDHCERHWHFEHSTVTYHCPECLEKLQSSSLLRTHIQREHPNSIYALFGLKGDECKARGFLNNLDYEGSKQPQPSDTDKLGDKRAPGTEKSKTTQLAVRGRALSGNEYRGKRFVSEDELLGQSLRTAGYVYDKQLLSKIGKPASPPPTGKHIAETSCFPPLSPTGPPPSKRKRACDRCRLRKVKVVSFLPAYKMR
jgi:hypothetical protein